MPNWLLSAQARKCGHRHANHGLLHVTFCKICTWFNDEFIVESGNFTVLSRVIAKNI